MLYIVIPFHTETKNTQKMMLDETKKLFPKAKIIPIRDLMTRGKGWAIRTGFSRALKLSASDNDLFAYIDGDFDIHPKTLYQLKGQMKSYDIAVGRKKLKNIPLFRKIITFLSRIYINHVFKIGVDTQTGIKMFRKKAICLVKENGFLFDVIMLKQAKENGYSIHEVPVDVHINKNLPISALFTAFGRVKKLA